MPEYLSVRQACAHVPGRPHVNSIRRWMTEGCYGIKLRSVRFGGKRLTTKQWLAEFTDAVTSRGGQPGEHLEAEAKLDSLGVR